MGGMKLLYKRGRHYQIGIALRFYNSKSLNMKLNHFHDYNYIKI
jgi:hypothetical protein